jgi:hypothetical protein
MKKRAKDEGGTHTDVLVLGQAFVFLTRHHTEGVRAEVITLSNR